ncbi:MAG: GNAT family N-acetyltransferase [Planctomycetaceae bacterium]|nr:GNAT family N-acetyltransferase [Planctomycetaceae bacterium]
METETVEIRRMAPADLKFVEELVAAAGWNQLPRDWQRVLHYEPRGCATAWLQGRLVGTVTTTCYGRDLAWIGMMLVHPQFRRRGIATLLMKWALRSLQDRNIACIKLDATPEGRFVYEQLGFTAEWDFCRWERPSPADQTPPPEPTPTSHHAEARPEADDGQTAQLDHAAFGTDRSDYLHQLAQDSTVIRKPKGYGMIRAGRRATYLGPVVAQTPEWAAVIVRELLSGVSDTVFWDPPGPNLAAVELARQLGFQPVRTLTRMQIGVMPTTPDLTLQYAITAPETG